MVFVILDPLKDKPKIYQEFKHDHATPEKKAECNRCKFDTAENSIPKKQFKVKSSKKDGTPGIDLTVNKISIVRGRYGDCIGWLF